MTHLAHKLKARLERRVCHLVHREVVDMFSFEADSPTPGYPIGVARSDGVPSQAELLSLQES